MACAAASALQQPRIGRDIDAEAPRVEKLRHQAEIGDGRRRRRSRTGRAHRRSGLRRPQGPRGWPRPPSPSPAPRAGRAARSRASTFRFCTGWMSQATRLRERAHLGAAQRILWQQRPAAGWVSSSHSMMASDWVSDRAGIVLQRRHQPLRVDGEKGGSRMFALAKVMRQVLGVAAPSDSARF